LAFGGCCLAQPHAANIERCAAKINREGKTGKI
jgi:hypothetical protein